MKKTIWKFALQIADRQQIEMPAGAQILTVQMQGGIAQMWAVVIPGIATETRTFIVYGTGHVIQEMKGQSREYIGTFQLVEEGLVFHLFELKTIK